MPWNTHVTIQYNTCVLSSAAAVQHTRLEKSRGAETAAC